MKTFTGAINRLGPERHGSSRNLGGGIIAGVLGMLFLAGASVCLADSTDVTENLSYYPANTIRRSGTGFTVYADVDRDGDRIRASHTGAWDSWLTGPQALRGRRIDE